MEDLKTCPFCGRDAILNKTNSDHPEYYVQCGNSYCKVRPTTWSYPTADKAVSAWNDRA